MLKDYTTQALALKDTEEAKKTIIAPDFYAVCEYLDILTKKLEHLRQDWVK